MAPMPLPPIPTPTVLPYHREMTYFLRSREKALWEWFASTRSQVQHAEDRRLELLKVAVRLDAESHPALHANLAEVVTALGISAPVHLYQAQQSPSSNAMLAYIPGEAHILFSGPLLQQLSEQELRVVLAHELAHYLFWEMEGGVYLIATRLLDAVASHPDAASVHVQSGRAWSLFLEIFADRIALNITKDLEASVASLVKVETGLANVSGAAYLRQAEEICAKGKPRTQGVTHPELFIRARALSLWHTNSDKVEEEVAGLLSFAESLEELDWLGQRDLTELTRQFLMELLRPTWMQTANTLGHAKLFFERFEPNVDSDLEIEKSLLDLPAEIQDFFLWVLLDFAVVDPLLEDQPLVHALAWSRRIGAGERFEKMVMKELKLKARNLKKLTASIDGNN